jgi:SAM-dependent methyltransferase
LETNGSPRYTGAAGAQYFAWQSAIGEVGGRLNLPKFLPYVNRSDVVLDFGCGGGYLLANLDVARKLGVEVNPAARATAARQGVETFESLSEVPSAQVDVVISNHALEHTHRPYDELTETLRVLKPGGHIVMSLPIDDWRSERRALRNISNHLYTWTPLLLGNLLREAGFEVKECRVMTAAWSLRGARLVSRLPAAARGAAYFAIAVLRRRRQIIGVARRPIR